MSKPWEQPIWYQDGGGRDDTERSAADVEELISRPHEPRERPARVDDGPIDYRRGDPDAVIDVEDEDDLPMLEDYVRPAADDVIQLAAAALKPPAVEPAVEPLKQLADELSAPNVGLNVTLWGISVARDDVTICVGGVYYRLTGQQLLEVAVKLRSWAEVAIQQ